MTQKNLIKTLICLVAITMLFTQCKKEKKVDYSFTIERDKEFAERALNEITTIKFNVKPDYDFAKIPMKYKVNYKQNAGVLMLNGIIVEDNSEYVLRNQENTFEYKGIKEGRNAFTITAINGKGVSVAEDFAINYATTDFNVTHTPVKPNATVWQGEEYSYIIKIKQENTSKPSNDYQIFFEEFDGSIVFMGEPVKVNTWYQIVGDISNCLTTIKTNQTGNVSLKYKVKNSTTLRDGYTIVQKVDKREIKIVSLSISDTVFIQNTNRHSIEGQIKKEPNSDNKNVFYLSLIHI